MTSAAMEMLSEFEQLTERDQFEVAREILLRARRWEYPDPTDDEITAIADEAFCRLDAEEATDGRACTR